MSKKLEKLLYRVDEVQAILSIESRTTIYKLLGKGELTGHNKNPGLKGLKITAESLEDYVERHEIDVEDWSK